MCPRRPGPHQNFFLYFYGALINLGFLAFTAWRDNQSLAQMFQGGRGPCAWEGAPLAAGWLLLGRR